jgi:hypothetical protein
LKIASRGEKMHSKPAQSLRTFARHNKTDSPLCNFQDASDVSTLAKSDNTTPHYKAGSKFLDLCAIYIVLLAVMDSPFRLNACSFQPKLS